MKTQNLNSLNGLEVTELTNGQMEVITGGATSRPQPGFVAGVNVGQANKPKPKPKAKPKQ